MFTFAVILCGYILVGVVVQFLEELWLSKFHSDILDITEEEWDDWRGPIKARLDGYSFSWLKEDIKAILMWPIGLVVLPIGIWYINNDPESKNRIIEKCKGNSQP